VRRGPGHGSLDSARRTLCATERIPYLATEAAAPYQGLRPIPVSVLLHNVRSLYNVGAFFRTIDAAGCDQLYLSGITGRPPHRSLAKTALGAEETVHWEHHPEPSALIRRLREQGAEIAAIETSVHATDLYDWKPRFPVCVLFGHEVDGLAEPLLELSDTHIRVPMLGRKHSLNVATAGGVVLYELLRKYRALLESAGIGR
jgi:23S rRNA (guanosine2251-2'-O)-methyltransferase